jgi:hypothetical protein
MTLKIGYDFKENIKILKRVGEGGEGGEEGEEEGDLKFLDQVRPCRTW